MSDCTVHKIRHGEDDCPDVMRVGVPEAMRMQIVERFDEGDAINVEDLNIELPSFEQFATKDAEGQEDGEERVVEDVKYASRDGQTEGVRAFLDRVDRELFLAEANVRLRADKGGTHELGATIDNVVLTWDRIPDGLTVTAQEVTSAVLAEAVGVEPGTRSLDLTGLGITDDTSFRVRITTDERGDVSDGASVRFRPRVYHGTSAQSDLHQDDAAIRALGGALAGGLNIEQTFSPVGEYIWLLYPASFGEPGLFQVGPLTASGWEYGQVEHVNAEGYSQTYRVFRSPSTIESGSYPITMRS